MISFAALSEFHLDDHDYFHGSMAGTILANMLPLSMPFLSLHVCPYVTP